MTNREYLSTLDNARLVQWILFEAPELGRVSINSPVFLAEWLDEEYAGYITIQEYGNIIMRQIEENGKTI